MEIVKTEEPNKPTYKKVDMREAKVADIIQAQRTAGSMEGAKYEAALLSQICKFDDKVLTMEDVEQMGMDDFFHLKDAMLGGALTRLVKQLLSSQDTPASAPNPS